MILLILFQLQDGVCTYIGIVRFGETIEANPLIRFIISIFGSTVGLLIPKLIGLSFIYMLHRLYKHQVRRGERLLTTMLGITLLNTLYAWSAVRWFSVLDWWM